MNDLTPKSKDASIGLWWLGVLTTIMLVITFIFGWIVAHNTVASECNKLGAFYVGSMVYECRVKK